MHGPLQGKGLVTDDQLVQAQQFIVDQFKLVRPRLLEAFGNVEEFIKDDSSPVTELDRQIEIELKEALLKFDSGIGFNGEEFGQSGNADTFWLIDPIDGTESFIRGLPYPRNVVTLINQGQPVLTVVYKFVTGDLFTAIKGKGSYKNNQLVHCSSRPLKRSWIELSAPLFETQVFNIAQAIGKQTNGFRITGDFTLIVEGKIDAMLFYKSYGGDWDYAPRALLMQEAGAKVANLGSSVYDYKNHDVLAASPVIFDQLMSLIVEANT